MAWECYHISLSRCVSAGLHLCHAAMPQAAGVELVSREDQTDMDNLHSISGREPGRDDLIVIAGGGGFIGGWLTRYFHEHGFTRLRAVDKKPLQNWYQRTPGAENLCLDLSESAACRRAAEGAAEVYNLAA